MPSEIPFILAIVNLVGFAYLVGETMLYLIYGSNDDSD